MSKDTLSKSKYIDYWRCPKLMWLNKHKPGEKEITAATEARFAAGHEVGEIAKTLFGNYVDVTAYNGKYLALRRMINATKREIKKTRPLSVKPPSALRISIAPSTS